MLPDANRLLQLLVLGRRALSKAHVLQFFSCWRVGSPAESFEGLHRSSCPCSVGVVSIPVSVREAGLINARRHLLENGPVNPEYSIYSFILKVSCNKTGGVYGSGTARNSVSGARGSRRVHVQADGAHVHVNTGGCRIE